jgi:hypothetical protein
VRRSVKARPGKAQAVNRQDSAFKKGRKWNFTAIVTRVT